MREFKFRAWCKNHKVMVYHIGSVSWDKTNKLFVNQDHKCAGQEVLMQYTGLHDNTDKEKEIYEGDNIMFAYENIVYIGEVKFEAGMFILCNNDLPDSYIPMFDVTNSYDSEFWVEGEIIGNIYES